MENQNTLLSRAHRNLSASPCSLWFNLNSNGLTLRRLRRRSTGYTFGRGVGERGELVVVGERKGFGVDAEAKAGGTRAVVEDVTEVAVAAGAEDFLAFHAVAGVD